MHVAFMVNQFNSAVRLLALLHLLWQYLCTCDFYLFAFALLELKSFTSVDSACDSINWHYTTCFCISLQFLSYFEKAENKIFLLVYCQSQVLQDSSYSYTEIILHLCILFSQGIIWLLQFFVSVIAVRSNQINSYPVL